MWYDRMKNIFQLIINLKYFIKKILLKKNPMFACKVSMPLSPLGSLLLGVMSPSGHSLSWMDLSLVYYTTSPGHFYFHQSNLALLDLPMSLSTPCLLFFTKNFFYSLFFSVWGVNTLFASSTFVVFSEFGRKFFRIL